MLLSFKRLDNKTVQVDSSAIFRIRPALQSVEPNAICVLHYDPNPADSLYDSLASKWALDDMVAVASRALPMVRLSSPTGTPVFIDAGKVKSITPPIKGVHYEGTKAVVFVLSQLQQVAETVDVVGRLVTEAREQRLAAG